MTRGSSGEVRRIIEQGGRIAFPPTLGEPDLASRLPELVGTAPTEVLLPFRIRHEPIEFTQTNVRVRAWFGGGRVDGRDYSPGLFDRLPRLISSGAMPLDTALIRVTPPNAEGMHNVGPAASVAKDLALAATNVIAEIDPDLPWAEGDTTFPASMVTASIDAEKPLQLPPESEHVAPSDTERRLAANVASLIPDGSFLQLGVGRTMQALVTGLSSHADLRLHTGLLNPGVRSLVESSAVDPDWTPRFGQALGPASLMQYIDHNRSVSFHSTRYIHSSRVIAGFDHFSSVNSALAVDLLGRCSSEGPVGRPRAGLGGLIDFLVAGRSAEAGATIIALRSTTSSGGSRVVPLLASAEVSVPTYLIEYIVTEWGVADIRYATRGECIERLIAIAHPDHRAWLAEASDDLMRTGEHAGAN
jgi:acyl-CoA hydrolase